MDSTGRRRIATIFSKEFREVFRDRRTVISVVVSPLFITPALFLLIGGIVGSEATKEKKRVYDIGVIGARATPDLAEAIGKIPLIRLHEMDRATAEHDIGAKTLAAAVVLPATADQLVSEMKPVPVEVLLDAGDEGSQAANARLVAGLSKVSEHVVQQRLIARGLPASFATPFKISQTPIKAGGNMMSLMLATMLPYMLVVSSFGGAIYASFDQVAGEKERGTLETLLISPASRREIVVAKFLAVTTVCLLSSVLSVIGVIVSFTLPGSALSALSKGGMHLSGSAIAVSLLMMLPLAVLFAGLLLAVSTFARNQKEAQTYITPILLMVMVPVMISIFVRSDVSRMMALAPILGASIIIKQAFSGTYDWVFIVMALTSSIFYGGLAVAAAVKLFETENVLIKA